MAPGAGMGIEYTILNVYAQAGETIQLGSSAMNLGEGFGRIYAPGTDLQGRAFPTDPAFSSHIFDCRTDDPGTGTISTRAQEQAGPRPAVGGYTPCEFVAPVSGIYPVILGSARLPAANGGGTVDVPDELGGQSIAMWDVTVRDASSAVRPGRLFSDQFFLYQNGYGSGVEVYPYTRTGYEFRLNLYGHSGIGWTLRADDQGVVDATTGERTFASFACGDEVGGTCVHLEAGFGDLAGRYPLFVNPIDPVAISGAGGLAETRGYATAPIATSTNPIVSSFTGADGQPAATDHADGGSFAFTSPSQMAGLGYTFAIDIDRDGTFGNGNDVVDRANLSASGTNSYTWNGRDAAGGIPQCGDYQYQVRSTLAEVHFPMFDVEYSDGTRIERLSLPGDATLGDPLAASYDDRDPYKSGQAVTDTSPLAVTNGTSGVGFHRWGTQGQTGPGNWTGNTDYVDTWVRLPEVISTGTFRVLCADLAIEKTASQNPAFPDQNLTYDLTVRNNGPDAAQNVVVSDSLPANVTVVAMSDGCATAGARVVCSLASLAAGASHTFKVTVRVAASAEGTLVNSADVSSDTHDPDPRNNRDEERVEVEPLADLEIVKRALSNRVVPGRRIAYELVVTNFGPSTARDVRVSDPLPRGLSFVSASRGCTFADGTVTCTAAELASGSSLTFRVVTRVAASMTANSVTNTATVESPTRDPDRGNNRDRETVPSGPEADLSIVKVPSVDTVKVGGQLFYTLLVRNDGPSDAQRVVVTDTAGAGLTLLSAEASQGGSCTVTASRVACSLGTLAAGGTAQVLVSARADQTGPLTNTATVDSPTEDPDRRDNRDERRVTGEPGPQPEPADLEIVKTANKRSILGSGTITYTLRVRNLGPGVATGVEVVDTPSLPLRVRSVRTSAGTCGKRVPVRCALGTLQPGATATVRIVAVPKAAGTLRNSASVTGNEPDPRSENNIDGTRTRVRGLLKVQKTASSTSVRAGGTVTYKVRVTNASSFALRRVRVCDRLPSGLVFVSSTPKAKLSKGKRCWTVRVLGAKKSKTFTLKVRVLRGAGGRKVNVATATAPNARGARSRAATGTAAIRVKPIAARGGGVTG